MAVLSFTLVLMTLARDAISDTKALLDWYHFVGMTLELLKWCVQVERRERWRRPQVEPKISKVCLLRSATLSYSHQVHKCRILSCTCGCLLCRVFRRVAQVPGDSLGSRLHRLVLDIILRNISEEKRQLRKANVDRIPSRESPEML